jgi:hypothetical protein
MLGSVHPSPSDPAVDNQVDHHIQPVSTCHWHIVVADIQYFQ